jgi:hypothetical protein
MKTTMKLATLIRKTREMAKPLAILGIRFNKIQFDKYFKKTIKQKNKHHCCFVFVSPWISDRSLIFFRPKLLCEHFICEIQLFHLARLFSFDPFFLAAAADAKAEPDGMDFLTSFIRWLSWTLSLNLLKTTGLAPVPSLTCLPVRARGDRFLP